MQRNVTVLTVSAMVLAGMLAPEAHADDHPRFEITPFAGYRTGGGFKIEDAEGNTSGSVDVGDDASYGVDLGLYRDDNSFYEFLYSQQQASLDSNDPLLNGLTSRSSTTSSAAPPCSPENPTGCFRTCR